MASIPIASNRGHLVMPHRTWSFVSSMGGAVGLLPVGGSTSRAPISWVLGEAVEREGVRPVAVGESQKPLTVCPPVSIEAHGMDGPLSGVGQADDVVLNRFSNMALLLVSVPF